MNMDNTKQGKIDVAVLVHSCDRYELLFKGFEFFFSKYWDTNVRCHYYFATEEKEISIRGFKTICSGKGEWADRLAFLLREKIQEKYVLYFQEDMWLTKKTNAAFFNKLFELAQNNDWQQVKLHSSNAYKTMSTSSAIEGFTIARIDNEQSDFLMSHQVTLWNKDFLLKQLHQKEHPWRNERKGTKRLKKLNAQIFHIDYFAENGQGEINKNNNPVLRSEYYTVSMNGVLNHNIERYLPALLEAGPEHRNYAGKLDYNYKNDITHDGKPKPRKVDIFKRAKNWLQGK